MERDEQTILEHEGCGLAAAAGPEVGPGGGGVGGGKRRRRGGTGGQEAPEVGAAGGGGQGAPKVCFAMRDKGTRAWDRCKFSHDRAIIAEARRAQEAEARAAKKGKRTSPKAQVCLQFLRGVCGRSEQDCKYSHADKDAQSVISAVYAGAAAGGVRPPGGGGAAVAGAATGGARERAGGGGQRRGR